MNTEEKLLKLRKLADAMYYAAQYLTTDASGLHKAMDEYHKFIINEYHKEEPTIPDIVDEHFDEMLGEEPANIKQEKEPEEYRQYRYVCGIKDPVMLNEIEEAYYQGMLKQKELMMKKAMLRGDKVK